MYAWQTIGRKTFHWQLYELIRDKKVRAKEGVEAAPSKERERREPLGKGAALLLAAQEGNLTAKPSLITLPVVGDYRVKIYTFVTYTLSTYCASRLE